MPDLEISSQLKSQFCDCGIQLHFDFSLNRKAKQATLKYISNLIQGRGVSFQKKLETESEGSYKDESLQRFGSAINYYT